MFIISFSNIAFVVDGWKAAGRRKKPNKNPNGKPQCGKKGNRSAQGGGGKPPGGRRRRYAVESRRRRQRAGKGNVFLLK